MLAAAGGWPLVPPLPALRRGSRHPQLPLLRERLLASADLSSSATAVQRPELFDRALEQGLKRFQSRHGLPAHGRLDEATLIALNVPVEQRIAAIELNLERWRWLPRELPAAYVLVNVPAFELHAVGGEQDDLRMKVITGRAGETPTPIFSSALTSVIFSPWWNVPPRIAEEEVLPAVQRSRRYLAQKQMEMTSDESGPVFRQRPGPNNPMGLVKFLLPNPYHVYLHDTPKDFLFRLPRRDLSHGCVRVEHPLALTRWLLQTPEWTSARIRKAMGARQEEHVALGEQVPVHVAYFTTWVEDDGTVRFLPDVYGHDEPQLRLLRGASPWQRMATSGDSAGQH